MVKAFVGRVGLCLALTACRAGPSPQSAVGPGAARSPDQVVEDFTLDSFVQNKKEWTLRSPRADVFESERHIDIRNPFVQFYEHEALSSTLEAGRGRVSTENKDIWAWDQAVMRSTDGARLTSDSMHYVSEKNRIVSTAPVTIVRGGSTVQGLGWEATPDLSQVQIRQQRTEISGSETFPRGRTLRRSAKP